MTGARVGLGLSGPAAAPFAVALALFALASPANATIRYGAAQISGNLESQQLFRLDRSRSETFEAFDLVQQRNTFRFQYEHDLIENGRFLDLFDVGLFDGANVFFYHRLVYDSVYDIAPGPFFRSQEGGKAGSFDSIPGSVRTDVALENVIREAFVDLDLAHAPVSFRIGRQQIVWGNTVNFRALDSVNALDLSWHLQQEAGILGKVGFSELRIPSWAVKALWNVGTIGPLSSVYLEAYDIPFEFQTTEVAFLPKPWSVNVRNPFRAGLAIEAAPGVVLQPCFDRTGFTVTNAEAEAAGHAPDFDDTSRTGLCDAEGLRRSTLRRGLYDPHDPSDVNQFGARLGGNVSELGLGFALAYMHRRHITDATGGAAAKAHAGLVESNQLGFVELDVLRDPLAPTHDSTDPLTGETTTSVGYVRIPVEFYFPYVNVLGLSLDYFDSWTSAVYNVEVAASQGVPIASVSDPRGLRRTWEMEMALLVDRPTWIRLLNPRSTWNVLAQLSTSFLPFHEDGDVGVPNSVTIPGQFGDGARLDRRRQVEMLSIFAMQTFYWGGSLSPLLSMIVDWSNAPAISWQAFLQYLPRPDVIIEPGVRIFWTNGRVVDDRYQVAKNAGRSEFQLKLTYQY